MVAGLYYGEPISYDYGQVITTNSADYWYVTDYYTDSCNSQSNIKKRHSCEYCGSKGLEDSRGNCASCGAPLC